MSNKLPQKPDLSKGQYFADELLRESSRGCALLAASWLENAVKDLLRFGVIKSAPEELLKNMFNGFGPYSNFSACINACYLNGYISQNENKCLHVVKKIRNQFAHNDKLNLNFNDPPISCKCEKLSIILPLQYRTDSGQMLFSQCVSSLLISITHMRRAGIKPATEVSEFIWQ